MEKGTAPSGSGPFPTIYQPTILFKSVRKVTLGPGGAVAPARILLQDAFGQGHLVLRNLEESAAGIVVALHEVLLEFFEAAWVHKRGGKYYFSYSTGDTHCLCYAIGDSPYGPFTYQGKILTPVIGWTTHHSIVEFGGKWWLFHHDSAPSQGINRLRSLKVCELTYNEDGTIRTIEGMDE